MRAKLCNLVYCMDNNQKHENKKNRWTPRWNDICKSASKTRGSERQSSKITTFSREQRSAVKFHQQKMLKDHTEREKNLPLKLPYILHCMLACHYLSSPFTLPLRLSMSPVDEPISSNMHVWKCQCYILWKLEGSGCLQSHNVTVFSVLSKEALPGDFYPNKVCQSAK